jgi:hypothetical protein
MIPFPLSVQPFALKEEGRWSAVTASTILTAAVIIPLGKYCQ